MALLAQRSLGHVAFRGLAPEGPPEVDSVLKPPPSSTANLHTKILDFTEGLTRAESQFHIYAYTRTHTHIHLFLGAGVGAEPPRETRIQRVLSGANVQRGMPTCQALALAFA